MQNMTEAQKKATSKSMVEAGFNVAQKGDYDNAIKEFKNAIELDPKNKQAYIDLASAYLGKKFYDLTGKTAKECLSVAGDDPGLYYSLAEADSDENKLGESLKALKKD